MLERINCLGVLVSHAIYSLSIMLCVSRLLSRPGLARCAGYAILFTALPLVYLLLKAPQFERPALYYIQIGLMLAWLLVEFILDYLLKIEFRQVRWMVIAYVTLFFAGTGGMLGIAAYGGRTWTITAVILFLVMAVLAFVQRAVTGL